MNVAASFAIGLCLLAPVSAAGGAKKLSWAETVSECGRDGIEDYATPSGSCYSRFVALVDNKTAGGGNPFAACEEEYCIGTQGTWTNGSCAENKEFCGLGCGCLESSYARFMACSFEVIVSFLDYEDCRQSEIRECVMDSRDEYVDDCKRGVENGRVPWMSRPMPEDCDEDLICASSSLSPIGLLSVIATIIIVMFS
ncbi:hypothetical protein DIPPA_27957 [Diplonema papillatum]|nr:hypothetical protein DIPPA_27957 [Diplonema papillatum]